MYLAKCYLLTVEFIRIAINDCVENRKMELKKIFLLTHEIDPLKCRINQCDLFSNHSTPYFQNA